MDYDELDNMERKITESVISTNMLTEKNHHFDAADNKNMDRLFDMLINHAADTIRTQFEHNPSDFDGKSLVILNPVRRSAMSNKSMNCFSRYLYLLCKKSKLDKSILGKINTHDPFVHIDDSEFSRVMRAEKFMLGSFPDITLVVPVRSSRDMSDRDVMYVAGLAKMFTNTSIAQGAGAVSQSSFNLTNDAGVQQRLTLFLSD